MRGRWLLVCGALLSATQGMAQPTPQPQQPQPQPQQPQPPRRPEPEPDPDPAPSPPPPPPEQIKVATCDGCARARANLANLDARSAEVVTAALPTIASLGQLGVSSAELTHEQARVLEDVESDRALVAAVRAYARAYNREGLLDLARLACNVDESPCVHSVALALDCVSNQGMCRVQPYGLPVPERPQPGCDPWSHTEKARKGGFGAEVITGWQDSAFPNEHRAWGFAFEVRRGFGREQRYGVVGRVGFTRGRDAGVDQDGDGRDDVATGAVNRLFAMGGGSMRFLRGYTNDAARFLELDALVGYTEMTSPGNENGVVAALDLSYQLAAVRVGLRAEQGVFEARGMQAVLAHLGIVVGPAPARTKSGGCSGFESGRKNTSTKLALAIDIPLSGYELGTGIGYSPPFGGLGIEGAYRLHPYLQLLGRGDLLVFLNGDEDHVLHHSLLAGARIDLAPVEEHTLARRGPFVALLAGYGWGAVTEPAATGSGPVGDVSVGYAYQMDDGMMWARLHGRFGMTKDNEDLRAAFVSVGLELRLDRRSWAK